MSDIYKALDTLYTHFASRPLNWTEETASAWRAVIVAARRTEKAEAEAETLRGSLAKYGGHRPECAVRRRTEEQIERGAWPACDCGFAEALAGGETKEETS